MAYEVFPAPVRKGAMSNNVFSVKIGSQSITLNETASQKFKATEVEVSVICLYDAEAKRAAIRPSMGFENGQFKISPCRRSKYVRVIGLKPFLVATGMMDSMYCKDARCEWDEPTQTLSWAIERQSN